MKLDDLLKELYKTKLRSGGDVEVYWSDQFNCFDINIFEQRRGPMGNVTKVELRALAVPKKIEPKPEPKGVA